MCAEHSEEEALLSVSCYSLIQKVKVIGLLKLLRWYKQEWLHEILGVIHLRLTGPTQLQIEALEHHHLSRLFEDCCSDQGRMGCFVQNVLPLYFLPLDPISLDWGFLIIFDLFLTVSTLKYEQGCIASNSKLTPCLPSEAILQERLANK